MKRIVYKASLWSALLGVFCCVCSCSDDFEGLEDSYFPTTEDYGYNPLGIAESYYFDGSTSLNAYGFTGVPLTLYCNDNFSWRFTQTPEWLSFSQMEGTGSPVDLTFSLTENPSISTSRSAAFYLESAMPEFEMKRMYTALQGVQDMNFSLKANSADVNDWSTESALFTSEGGNLELHINSNFAWHVREPNDQVDFVQFSQVADSGDCVIMAKVLPNDYLDGTSRSNTFYFYDDSLYSCWYTYTIYQAPPKGSESMSYRTLKYSKEGGTQTLSLGSATNYRVECDLAWASVTPLEGTGKVDLTISVLKNETTKARSGYVYLFVNDVLKMQIALEQAAYQMTLLEKEVRFEADSKPQTMKLLTVDGPWKASVIGLSPSKTPSTKAATSDESWLTVSPMSGEAGENIPITFSAAVNNSLSSRKVTVLFERTDGIVQSVSLTVTQDGRYFNFGDYENGVTLGPDAQTKQCIFSGDLPWTASTSDSWITVKTTSGGTTSNAFTFSVTANATQESRVGEIIFKYEGGEKKFAVLQESAYLNTSSSIIEFPSTGGTHELSVSTNGMWTLGECADWLSTTVITEGGLSYPTVLKLTAPDNPSANDRSTTVTLVMGVNKSEKKLAVTQKGRYLRVPVTEVNFFLKGGKRSFYIESDGKLSISSSESWLTAKLETGNMLYLTASENTSGKERSATVTVTVTGLTSGELKQTITVKQLNSNVIEREEYGEDESIDLGGNGQAGVNKGEWGGDKTLDGESSNSVTVNKNGFGEDKDLN